MEIVANPKNYRMKQSWRQASMQVLNSSVARPWKLEQNTSGQASRQALRASRLWKLEQNNMTKKGPFFGPQNVRKSRRAKMGLASSPKVRPRLVPEVLRTFASHGRDHRLTASRFSRAPLIGNTYMVMLRMDTARPFGCALPIMEIPYLFIDNEVPKCSSTEHFRTESSLRYQTSLF